MGFGNRPVSGRRVTLTRSPTTSSFNAFASDSNIAIAPPERIFSKTRRHFGIMISARKRVICARSLCAVTLTLFRFNFFPTHVIGKFRGIVRERLQDRRDHSYRHLIAYPARPSCPVQAVLSILSSNREKGVTYEDQDHHQHDT